MTFLGWCVLGLVFVDEVIALIAFALWGYAQDPWWVWVWLLPVLAMQAWFWFASPRARYGGPVLRPLVKVLVFGLAAWALWDLGHPTEAIGFLVFSVAVNAIAQVPGIAALAEQGQSREP
ncbi:YrdB family protein [Nocardioides sp. HB32]